MPVSFTVDCPLSRYSLLNARVCRRSPHYLGYLSSTGVRDQTTRRFLASPSNDADPSSLVTKQHEVICICSLFVLRNSGKDERSQFWHQYSQRPLDWSGLRGWYTRQNFGASTVIQSFIFTCHIHLFSLHIS